MRNQESALNSNQLEQFPVIRVTITASIILTLTDEKYFLNWKPGQAKFKTAICLLTCRSTSIPLISLIIVKAIFSSLIIGPHTWPARVGIVWTDPSHNKYGRLLAYYHHWANTIIRNSPLIDSCPGCREGGYVQSIDLWYHSEILRLFHNTTIDGGQINLVIAKSRPFLVSWLSPRRSSQLLTLSFIWKISTLKLSAPERKNIILSALIRTSKKVALIWHFCINFRHSQTWMIEAFCNLFHIYFSFILANYCEI